MFRFLVSKILSLFFHQKKIHHCLKEICKLIEYRILQNNNTMLNVGTIRGKAVNARNQFADETIGVRPELL